VVTAWVLAQGTTVMAIPGARSPEHARDAATSAGLELEAEDLESMTEAEFSSAR